MRGFFFSSLSRMSEYFRSVGTKSIIEQNIAADGDAGLFRTPVPCCD
jgi:hypothetical protein